MTLEEYKSQYLKLHVHLRRVARQVDAAKIAGDEEAVSAAIVVGNIYSRRFNSLVNAARERYPEAFQIPAVVDQPESTHAHLS